MYKALLSDISKQYSDKYQVPIEIRTRKVNYISTDPKPDKILVIIPNDKMFNQERDIDKRNLATFEKMLQEVVTEFGHIYKIKREEITSLSDLRQKVSQWEKIVGVSIAWVKFDANFARWGSCQVIDFETCGIKLSERFKFIPMNLIESIIVHELCHAKQWLLMVQRYGANNNAARAYYRSDHDKEFWDLLTSYYPNHKQTLIELEEYWNMIFEEPPPTEG